ncbi:MAG TPA: glycosyltransferase [Clostridiales bacterium]|nr:glycosyltransferase [Clostridiales bacterium]
MVSFIVIGKNEGWRLEKCLSSIKYFVNQENISNYEVVYVDSKSTDNSIDIARKYDVNTILLVTGECNAAIGRNIGARNAKGNILFFIDGDMELLPGFWSSIVNDDKQLIYPFISGIERDIRHNNSWEYIDTKIRRKHTKDKDSFEMAVGGLFAIQKKLWEAVGEMDNRLKVNEDIDLGIRLSKLGYRLCRKPQIWVNHYTVETGLRTNTLQAVKYTALLSRKHFFNIQAQLIQFPKHYSSWMLCLCGIISIVLWSFIPLVLYLFFPVYRTIRIKMRTPCAVNVLKTFYKAILRDFLFLYHLITYFPITPSLEYKKV